MSIESKIAELLEESAKLKALEETTEEEIEVVEEELDEDQLEEGVEKVKVPVGTRPKGAGWGLHKSGEQSGADHDIYKRTTKAVAKPTGLGKVAEDLTLEDYSIEELEDFMMSEEFEQLDEASRDKLNKYLSTLSYKTALKRHGDGTVTEPETLSPKRKASRELAYNKLHRSDSTKVPAKESVDVQEDVDALLFGEDLTEEFKVKAATIFEAAVMSRVNAEVATLEEAFEARLEEEAELAKEGIIEKVDGYLDYVVEQWMSDNEVAIENGLKNDIFEGFIQGMKGLFEEHYIEVPEERFDVVGDLQEQVNFLESKLDESLETNVEMAKQLNEMARDSITDEFCSDMTDTEVEKFTALAEELSYEGVDSYTSKLQIIKENYFGKKPAGLVDSVVTDSPVQLTEETNVNIDSNVARYLETFNRFK